MARRKKIQDVPPPVSEQAFSYTSEAILCVAALAERIRIAVKERALDKSEIKKKIPKSAIESAAKDLGLAKWLKD